MRDVHIIDPTPLVVGEGPLWDEERELLYTLDIRGMRIRRLRMASGEWAQADYPQQIGCLALTADGSILAAMEKGVYIAHPDGGLTPVCVPERIKGRRFNDGKVGPDGRLYLGTTDDRHEGAFYRLDPDGTLTELLCHIGCSNGLAWSRDARTLYYCDSPDRVLEAFDFDAKTGTIANRRTVMPVPCGEGVFDGMTIDREDRLWIAVWGDGCALRVDPASARVLERVTFPASRVSCCGFAGPDLRTLVVTSAAYHADPAREPGAGRTYAVRVETPGLPTWRFGVGRR